ncbi:DUF7507 domain-containing protein [Brevibacterium mcbrellneri]|nr:SdrD B-like domain-containing protein [Brevibacterium mcbrellneri]
MRTQMCYSLFKRMTAILAVLALLCGMTVLLAQPAAASEELGDPGDPQAVEIGDSRVQYSLTLAKDGGTGCLITKGNGYETGDNTATDGNICAGDIAHYNVNLNVKTAGDPVTFTVTPTWLSAEARAAGLPEPTVKPTLKSGSASYAGVSATVDAQGAITVKADAGTNATVALELTASTIQSLELRGGQNPEGTFNLGLKAAKEDGSPLTTAVADKKLNVLVEPRFDQMIEDPQSGVSTTTRNGVEYIGISARSGLPAYPSDQKHSPAPSGATPKGRILPIDPETISRYTLVMPENAPFKADEVLVSYAGGDWQKAKVDSNGNPYVDGKYEKSNPPFRFLIPTQGLPSGKTDFTTRMDIVDKDGKPARVKDSRGVPSNIPTAKGNKALGDNTADPGGLSECSASTADAKQGLLAGKFGFPNNNCAKQTVDLTKWKCTHPGGCPSAKYDVGVNWVETEEKGKQAFNFKQALKAANVRMEVTPVDVKNNPTICSVWQPGVQRVASTASNIYVPTVQIGNQGRQDIQDVFPDAKVYITKADKTNGGQNPDCSGDADWEVFYDASAKVTGNTFAKPGKMNPNEIAGIKIVIPGENVIQRPITFRYVATTGAPSAVAEQDTVKAKEGDEEYYKTTNFSQFFEGDKKKRDSKDVILAEKPSAGVRDIWGDIGEKRVGGIGVQKQEIITAGQVVVNNGTSIAVNSKDVNGDPTRVHMRVYLSKCITADEDSLSPGMTYHKGQISNDPKDCAPSTDNYIERTWALSDQKNETGDPKNDPFFPIGWADKNADKSSDFYQPWDNGQPKPKFTVKTPAWSGPGQTFDIVHSYRITGTPEIKLDEAVKALKEDTSIKAVTSSANEDAYTGAGDKAKDYTPLDSRAALTTLTVPNVVTVGLQKDVKDKLVDHDTQFQHSLKLTNYTEAQLGQTQFIDVLPFNGDWRDTKFSGEYWLKSVPEYVGSSGVDGRQIYYTNDDPNTVSVCPTNAEGRGDLKACENAAKATKRDVDEKPSNTKWELLTEEVIEAQAKPGAKHITALRFDSPLVKADSDDAYLLDFQSHGNKHGDKYVNSTGVSTLHATLGDSAETTGVGALPIPQPDPVKTEVYAAKVSGTVYHDENRDEKQQDGEKNLSGYTVTLYEVDENGEIKKDDNGEPVVAGTTKSDKDGNYTFESVKRGNYRVVVSPLEETDINTEAGKGEAGSWNGKVITVTEPKPEDYDASKPQAHTKYDFGVFKPAPKISLKKTVNGKETAEVVADGKAEFVLAGENNGNVDLDNVKLADTWVEGKEPVDLECTITPKGGGDYDGNATEDLKEGNAKLAVGDAYECTGTYTVTQDDVDEQVTLPNDAEVTGKYLYKSATTGEDKDIPVEDKSKATVTVPQAKPALDVTKAVDGQKSVQKKAGEKAEWSITGKNTGNVTLHNVKLDDKWTGGDIELTCKQGEEEIDVLEGGATLAVGAEFTCTGESDITQDHVDGEEPLPNNVTLTGNTKKDPDAGTKVGAQDTATVTVPKSEPSLSLEKTVTNWADNVEPFSTGGTAANRATGPEPLTVGDTVKYQFILTNNGNVTLKNVKINDPKVEDIDCGVDNITLAPGESIECTASHVLTAADVEGQTEYVNTANAEGDDPKGKKVKSNEPSAKVEVATPKIELEKKVKNKKASYRVGDAVVYTFVVANSGKLTVNNVKVEDSMLEKADVDVTCEVSTLAPGEKTTCESGEYTVTEADAKAGEVVNTAVAVGTSRGNGEDDGTPVRSNESSAVITVDKSEEPTEPGTEEPTEPGTEEPDVPGTDGPGKPDQPDQPGNAKKPEWLPRTGTEVTAAVLAGLALVVAGGVLTFGARRKR